MIIDHIGVAVSSLQRGIDEWATLFGYRQVAAAVENSRQKVRVVFLGKEGSMVVKLVEPTAVDSPIAGFVRRGGGLQHLCFRCSDLAASVPQMKQGGARILVNPEPGEAFQNHPIAFCLTRGNVNIELIDTDEKGLFSPHEWDRGTS